MNVLKKETKRRNYSRGTGNGSPIKVNFTDIEEKLLKLLTPEAAEIASVPQGGVPVLKKPHIEQILTFLNVCEVLYLLKDLILCEQYVYVFITLIYTNILKICYKHCILIGVLLG